MYHSAGHAGKYDQHLLIQYNRDILADETAVLLENDHKSRRADSDSRDSPQGAPLPSFSCRGKASTEVAEIAMLSQEA